MDLRRAASALIALLGATVAQAQSQQPVDTTRPRLAIVGFARDVDLQAWRDARIGNGLVAALADTLFGSGLFRLLEEKDEVRTELRTIAARLWASQREHAASVDSEVTARLVALHPDVAASGRVLRFEAPSSRMSIGPMQRAQRSFIVEVEVSLREMRTGRVHTARGEAEANRVAVSAIFSVQNDKVLLDNTAVGKATMDALNKAVGQVLEIYRSSKGR